MTSKWSSAAKKELAADMELRLGKQFDFALVIQDIYNEMLQPIATKAVLAARSMSRHAKGTVNDVEDDKLIKIFIDVRNQALTEHMAKGKHGGNTQEEAFTQAFHAVVDALVPHSKTAAAAPPATPPPPAPPGTPATQKAATNKASKLQFAVNLNFV